MEALIEAQRRGGPLHCGTVPTRGSKSGKPSPK